MTVRYSVRFCVPALRLLAVLLCLCPARIPISAAENEPAPEISLTASPAEVFVGEPVTLTWSSRNASTCKASGAWTGSKPLSGSAVDVPEAAGSPVFHLICKGAGGTREDSVSVTVTSPAVSIESTFKPNTATISTSEGAPYWDCDFWTQSGQTCTYESNLGYGPTRVMRLYICLTGEVTFTNCSQEPPIDGPLSQQMLADIDTRLAAYQGTGMRVMPRFIYNFGPIKATVKDAPLDVILTHIDQLAPIVLKYKDIVFALEAGFIGTWGEWHDSTNGNDTADAHAQVLNKELGYFRGLFPILVRYPGDLIQYGGTKPVAGLGMHDDYYASDSDDGATWNPCAPTAGYCLENDTPAEFESYAVAVSTSEMFAGEFGALYPTLQTCAALDAYSYTYHPQSINLYPYPTNIGTELVNEGCALSFYNKVGTRIEIEKAAIIGDPVADGKLYVALTLRNAGYGRVIRPRPVTIEFIADGKVEARIPIPLADLDLRRLKSTATPEAMTFGLRLKLPEDFDIAGETALALLIPDPAPSLTPQPAYALPLNSVDGNGAEVFDAATGYNVIGSFTVR
jgi:hypothetical protein